MVYEINIINIYQLYFEFIKNNSWIFSVIECNFLKKFRANCRHNFYNIFFVFI